MAEQAFITTAWIEVEDDDGQLINTPAVTLAYPFIKWTDITGQPSENIPTQPNQYNIELHAETVDMDAIAADPAFQILPGTRTTVGQSSTDFDAVPDQAQFDVIRAQIMQNLDDVGEPAWTDAEFEAALGSTPDDRPNGALTEQITTYLKRRRKRVEFKTVMNAERQASPNELEVGYRAQGVGTLDPTDYNTNRIQQIHTNTIHFSINLRDSIITPNLFRRVKIIKKNATTPDAFKFVDGEIYNGNTAIRWPTTFEFTPGERYRIKFVE